jgi:hypothetical protein
VNSFARVSKRGLEAKLIVETDHLMRLHDSFLANATEQVVLWQARNISCGSRSHRGCVRRVQLLRLLHMIERISMATISSLQLVDEYSKAMQNASFEVDPVPQRW